MAIEKIKILGPVLELPARQHYQFSSFMYLKNWPNWRCCLSSSSKTAPRIIFFFNCPGAGCLIFTYPLLSTYAPQFLEYNISVLCLVHLLSQNLVWAYLSFLSMLIFLCTFKIILVYSKVRFYYINWLIWVHLKCFEYSLKNWVYLKI